MRTSITVVEDTSYSPTYIFIKITVCVGIISANYILCYAFNLLYFQFVRQHLKILGIKNFKNYIA